MTQIDNRFGCAPNAVVVLRGDERMSRSIRLGSTWFCQIHGHQRGVKCLAFGETYYACRECLYTSPGIILDEAKTQETL